MPITQGCFVSSLVEITMWFWRRRWKCEKFTTTPTMPTTTDKLWSEKRTWAFVSGELKHPTSNLCVAHTGLGLVEGVMSISEFHADSNSNTMCNKQIICSLTNKIGLSNCGNAVKLYSDVIKCVLKHFYSKNMNYGIYGIYFMYILYALSSGTITRKC